MGGKNEGKSFGDSYNWKQTAAAAAGGVFTDGLSAALGRMFGMPRRPPCNPTAGQLGREYAFHGTTGLVGGLAGDAISQGVDIAGGEQAAWSWGRLWSAGAQGA